MRPVHAPLLELKGVSAGYPMSGGAQQNVLCDVSLQVFPGETLAVLGRNGSGRSTLAKAVVGLLPAQGALWLDGQSIDAIAAHERAQLGLGYSSETRDVFAGLTVAQNLELGVRRGVRGPFDWDADAAYSAFAPLAERRKVLGGALSGGEQKLLALARSLMGRPRVLVADEPTEGLSPQMSGAVIGVLRRATSTGMALVLIEQKLHRAAQMATVALVIGQGRVVWRGAVSEALADTKMQSEWLMADVGAKSN